jgi:hypothetical protein
MNTCRKTGAASRATGPPADDVLPFLLHDVLEEELAGATLAGVSGEKEHADRVATGAGQLHAQLGAFTAEELVRQLDDDAGAVSGARIAADRAAMREILEQLETLAYDLVRRRAADVGDETNAARVALVPLRIVQALLLRQSVVHVQALPTCARLTYEEAPPNRWSGGAVAPFGTR